MIAALSAALAVLLLGGALRPRPVARRPARKGIVAAGPTDPQQAPVRRRLATRFTGRVAPVRPDDVAAWCEALARVVRSGGSLSTAIRTVDPPDGGRRLVAETLLAVDRGGRLADALSISTSSPHLNLAITVLRACAANGGPAAEPLDRAAAVLRSRAADAVERRTYSAQARMSTIVMTVLPVAMLTLLLTTSSSTRAAAVQPLGGAVIAFGAALNLIGWRWMRHIIGRTTT